MSGSHVDKLGMCVVDLFLELAAIPPWMTLTSRKLWSAGITLLPAFLSHHQPLHAGHCSPLTWLVPEC